MAVQSAPAAPPSDALGGPRPGPEDAHPDSVGFLPKLGNKSPSAARDSGIITRSDGVLLSDGPAGEGRASLDKRGDDSSCKEPLLKDPGGLAEGHAEEKQPLPAAGRRRRRFTGDSGIEVCVCGRSSGAGVREGRELKELESLLGCAEDEDEDNEEEEEGDGSGDGEFCENCGPRAHLSEDEEQAQGGPESRVDREPWAAPQPPHQTTSSSSDDPPTPSLLHTINEQEGPHHGPEPQG